MKFQTGAVLAIAASQAFDLVAAKHSHNHEVLRRLERKHRHHLRATSLASRAEAAPVAQDAGARSAGVQPLDLRKRGTCDFPSDAGLVSITPGSSNAGWALPPDKACSAGMFCPYACPPGQVMAQWDPNAVSYTYPLSQNGGLLCGLDGTVSKPFPNKPYCMDGASNIGVKDNTGKGCAVCQTVLPGMENMIIPTDVNGWSVLSIPNSNYWAQTASHFYINPPGVSTDDGCVWGDSSKPQGNWAPYVAGGNQDSSGQTYLKIGWNPKYTDGSASFSTTKPSFGVAIECDGDGCNGLPCKIDPASDAVNQISGGGASWCVVTVPSGVKANVVVFDAGSSSSDAGAGSDSDSYSDASNGAATITPAATAASATYAAGADATHHWSPHILLENETGAASSAGGAAATAAATGGAGAATGGAGGAGASATAGAAKATSSSAAPARGRVGVAGVGLGVVAAVMVVAM